ncbi:MAG: aldo/keto reductase [Candidatus Ornithospirochaeta sp.]
MYEADENRYKTMEYPRAGKSGLRLPRVSLGLWHNFGRDNDYSRMRDIILYSFDHGITHFDLANNYGPPPGEAERNFGRILEKDLRPYRDELIISTKAGYEMQPGPYGDGGGMKYLMSSLDNSLKRMGLEYVDIYYHHRMDKDTPLEETMYALSRIVQSGKAIYIGLSNYDGETMRKADDILRELRVPFVMNQNSYNIFNRTIEKNGLLEASGERGKGIISFSPLAQGLLTDRYLSSIPKDSRAGGNSIFLKESDITEEKRKVIRKLNALASRRGETLSQMALEWVLSDNRVTSVLVGASSVEQMEKNIRAERKASFTKEEMEEIDDAASSCIFP